MVQATGVSDPWNNVYMAESLANPEDVVDVLDLSTAHLRLERRIENALLCRIWANLENQFQQDATKIGSVEKHFGRPGENVIKPFSM
jgi:hypothetical protein